MNNDKNKVIVTDLTQDQVDNSLKWLERARADNEKPCDGFDLVKTSKVKTVLIAPILAVCGWLCLLYLISRR